MIVLDCKISFPILCHYSSTREYKKTLQMKSTQTHHYYTKTRCVNNTPPISSFHSTYSIHLNVTLQNGWRALTIHQNRHHIYDYEESSPLCADVSDSFSLTNQERALSITTELAVFIALCSSDSSISTDSAASGSMASAGTTCASN